MKQGRKIGILVVVLFAVLVACKSREEGQNKVAFVDSVKLFESFEMKKEYDKMIESDLMDETALVDSIGTLLEQARDSSTIFRLRKDYYLAEQLFNNKFEQLSTNYTKSVMERLNEYVADFAEERHLDLVVAGGNGTVLYVNDQIDLTDEMIDYANKAFNK